MKKYIRAFYEKNRLTFALGLFFALMNVPINLSLSWMLGAVMDTVVASDLGALGRLLAFGLGLAVVALFVGLGSGRTRAVFIHKGVRQYKALAFQKLSEKSISAFSKENTARYLSVLTNDVQTLEENYLNSLFDIVYQSIMLVCTLCFMLWYSPVMTAATVLFMLLPALGTALFAPEMSRREKAVSDGNERFMGRLKDLLSGFTVLKCFKAEKEAVFLFNSANGEIETLKLRRRWWTGLVNAVNWNFTAPLMQFGIFFFGAFLAIRGSITLGVTMVFVQLCNYLMQFVQVVPQSWASRKAAKGLIGKLAALAEENAARGGEPIAPVLSEGIALQNVTFGYEPEKPVLRNLSLRLEPGKKYALVGASGSGKSTLLHLLMGAYDTYEGSLTVDGRELRTVHPDSLYDLMSLIGQNVFLFDDTLQNNITMFRDFPAESVARAVRLSGLAPLVKARGGDYRCGENGGNLSGGERQRISIARCLLRGTPVLLLDEATASLDSETAFAVTDAILHLDGLTRLVVTHSLTEALLRQYDAIFVLKNGEVAEQGDFNTLMEKKAYFYSLYTVSNA